MYCVNRWWDVCAIETLRWTGIFFSHLGKKFSIANISEIPIIYEICGLCLFF